MNTQSRIDFLDTLRAFIIFLVIAMHAALAYVSGWPDWVHNPHTDPLFGLIYYFAESGVLMPILFFIAGYFTLPSLLKRSPGEFLRDKLARLGIPYVIGVVILSPVMVGLVYYANGGTLPLMQALFQFVPPHFVGQYHFWFLGVLLLYFALVILVSVRLPEALSFARSLPNRPSARFWAVGIGITWVACFAVNLVSKYSVWTSLYVLQFQSVKFPLYNAFFLLGMVAYQKGWFQGGYQPRLFPWAGIYLVTLVFMLGMVSVNGGEPVTVLGKALMNLTACVETLAALMTYLALFQSLQKHVRPFWMKLSSLSYSAYLIHLTVLFIVLSFTRDLAVPLFFKYLLQVMVTELIVWGSAYGIQKVAIWRSPGALRTKISESSD
ncbi:MAG TPA: acyltransferase family protein [Anaerolineaceae bacterium]|nr:acyltransferase family protein [Anaerolineaceae bacterium]